MPTFCYQIQAMANKKVEVRQNLYNVAIELECRNTLSFFNSHDENTLPTPRKPEPNKFSNPSRLPHRASSVNEGRGMASSSLNTHR
jgi:hypothetical protein